MRAWLFRGRSYTPIISAFKETLDSEPNKYGLNIYSNSEVLNRAFIYLFIIIIPHPAGTLALFDVVPVVFLLLYRNLSICFVLFFFLYKPI